MSATITFGWGLLPAIITFAAHAFALWSIPAPRPSSYGPAIQGFIYLSVATIVSLAAWLVWALWP